MDHGKGGTKNRDPQSVSTAEARPEQPSLDGAPASDGGGPTLQKKKDWVGMGRKHAARPKLQLPCLAGPTKVIKRPNLQLRCLVGQMEVMSRPKLHLLLSSRRSDVQMTHFSLLVRGFRTNTLLGAWKEAKEAMQL
jgi:hypothetical protein